MEEKVRQREDRQKAWSCQVLSGVGLEGQDVIENCLLQWLTALRGRLLSLLPPGWGRGRTGWESFGVSPSDSSPWLFHLPQTWSQSCFAGVRPSCCAPQTCQGWRSAWSRSAVTSMGVCSTMPPASDLKPQLHTHSPLPWKGTLGGGVFPSPRTL